MENKVLLVVNAGSSSLKIDVYVTQPELDAVTSVSVENIGSSAAELLPGKVQSRTEATVIDATDHTQAIKACLDWLATQRAFSIGSVAYRVVHGGARFNHATELDDEAVEYLRSITKLAPNHMPPVLACIDYFRTQLSDVSHVACFDTAFFADAPVEAKRFALPKRYAEKGVVRYGFHGLSYSYLLSSFSQHEGASAAQGRVIMLHLGSGASITATRGGVPVDMSMGFTPMSGIVMGTRTGDIDPGALLYIMQQEGLDAEVMSGIIMKQSGLLGVSGTTADMRELLKVQHHDEDAALAIELFCRSAKKTVGAYAALLGGVDSIIFTGGIGERSAEVRARILSGLEYLGVSINESRNEAAARLISADEARVGVHVIPAREDYSIATQAYELLDKKGGINDIF